MKQNNNLYYLLSKKLKTYCSLTSLNLLTADLTEAAAVVEYTQAPPATIRLHRLQDQIPTQLLFMASYKEVIKYNYSCVMNNFLLSNFKISF